MTEIPVETSADGAQPAPRRSGFLQFDIIVSLCAILISAVSLYVGIDNARVQHRLLAASSWPFLSFVLSDDYDGKHDIGIGVRNDGVGPARIKTFEISYRGRPIHTPIALLQACCGLTIDPKTGPVQKLDYASSSIDESVLRAGEPNIVLRFNRATSDPAMMKRLSTEMRHLTFRTCYCSVLDECWFGDLWTTRTEPVKACPPARERFDPVAVPAGIS